MSSRIGTIVSVDLRTRGLRYALLVGVPLALMFALAEVLAPVWLNGDAVQRGPWGIVYGAFGGTWVGLIVTLGALFVMLGGDLDRDLVAERLRLGERPIPFAAAQLLVVCLLGVLAWAFTALACAAASAGDAAVRALLDAPATVVRPPDYLMALGALGPLIMAGAAVPTWALIVAMRSGVRAFIVIGILLATFVMSIVSIPEDVTWALPLTPLGPAWRALSSTPIGSGLPAARHDSITPYVISAAFWVSVLAWAAWRGTRRLGLD